MIKNPILIFFVYLLLFSSLVNAKRYTFDALPDDGTREIAYATMAYQEHFLKSMDYTVNASTPGFIRKSVSNVREFNMPEGRHIVTPYFNYKWIEGAPVETGKALDFAINGSNKAFFTIQITPTLIGYTRDGRFRIDRQNRLVTIAGNFPILGKNGIIRFENNPDITVSRSGGLYNGSEFIDTIKVTVFTFFEEMNDYLHNLNGSVFTLSKDISEDTELSSYAILQGFVTQSNYYKSYDSKFYVAYHSLANQTLYSLIDNQKKLFNAVSN